MEGFVVMGSEEWQIWKASLIVPSPGNWTFFSFLMYTTDNETFL